MHRKSLLAAALAVFTILGFTTASADPARFDAQGVYRFPYGTPYPPVLSCSPERVCELMLEENEVVYDKVAGDTVRWIIADGVSGSHGRTPTIFFKPTDLGSKSDPMETNLIVTTNKRTYEVRLVAVSNTLHTRYGFYYPSEVRVVAPHAQAQATIDPQAAASPTVAPQALDFSYRVNGNADYRPLVVWNDGEHTYLKLARHAQSPSIYVVLVNGQMSMINYHPPVNDVYTIDGTPDHLLLIGTVGRHVPRVEIYHTR